MAESREAWDEARRRALAATVLALAVGAIAVELLGRVIAAPARPFDEPLPLRRAIHAIDSGEWLGTRQAALRDVVSHGAKARNSLPQLIEVMRHHRDESVRTQPWHGNWRSRSS